MSTDVATIQHKNLLDLLPEAEDLSTLRETHLLPKTSRCKRPKELRKKKITSQKGGEGAGGCGGKKEKENGELATHLAATHGLAVDDSETDGRTVHLWSCAYGGSKVVSK